MYAGVPTIIPVWVIRSDSPSKLRSSTAAMPKSLTRARPVLSSQRMFAALMSRWMMPLRWAAASAAAT